MEAAKQTIREWLEASARFEARADARTAAIERGEAVTFTIREWMEEQGINTSEENCYHPQEGMDEEVLEVFKLQDGSVVAFTEYSYVISFSGGHHADEREKFEDNLPDLTAAETVAEIDGMRQMRG